MSLADPFFRSAPLKITGVNLVLSGDNAAAAAFALPIVLAAFAAARLANLIEPRNLEHVAAAAGAAALFVFFVLGQRPARPAGGRLAATRHHQAR